MLKINGESVPEAAGQTVGAYLESIGLNINSIAVEWNEEILPKEKYDTTVLQDSDVVEIVTFMGGGC